MKHRRTALTACFVVVSGLGIAGMMAGGCGGDDTAPAAAAGAGGTAGKTGAGGSIAGSGGTGGTSAGFGGRPGAAGILGPGAAIHPAQIKTTPTEDADCQGS